MKKKIISVLSAAILGATLFSGVSFASTTAHVNNTVNFRDRPSISGDVYGYINAGTDVQVVELTNQYWIRVSYSGREGYISRPYVTVNGSSPTTPPQTVASKADQIIAYGKTFMGVKYVYGGDYDQDGSMGFDCSGFMHYIFAKYGVNITRQSASSAAKDGYTVSYDQLQPGDLVYFYSPIHHVGVYIGNGQVLHTYKVGVGVTISSITPGSFFYSHITTMKRVL